MTSLRDTLLIAGFEIKRAIRTWRALALFLLYLIANTGAAYLFVQVIGAMEQSLARTLGVAAPDTPGALMESLVQGDMFRRLLEGMVGSAALVDDVLSIPVLAIFNLWFCLLLIPFFAASASAESIALDMGSRALRYEALRTGRLELVLGRFVGQLGLTLMASGLSVSGVWVVGMFAMTGNDPVELALHLVYMTGRAWAFSVPFVGFGVACSQLTTSAAWARVMAIGGTAASWLLYGVARYGETTQFAFLSDLGLQILPQGWMRGLWSSGPEWFINAGVCGALGLAVLALGYLRFAGRDL